MALFGVRPPESDLFQLKQFRFLGTRLAEELIPEAEIIQIYSSFFRMIHYFSTF